MIEKRGYKSDMMKGERKRDWKRNIDQGGWGRFKERKKVWFTVCESV